MNENINLCEILKDCPKGTKLYSPLSGECRFNGLDDTEYPINLIYDKSEQFSLTKEGWYWDNAKDSECMLWPSKEVHTWEGFKVKKPKFDPKTLKPFDRVLISDSNDIWQCELFSHVRTVEPEGWCQCLGDYYGICIPYNEDTKHLVGTSEEAPEFYRYWEE